MCLFGLATFIEKRKSILILFLKNMNSTRALTVLELMSGRGLDNSIDGPLILSNQVDSRSRLNFKV